MNYPPQQPPPGGYPPPGPPAPPQQAMAQLTSGLYITPRYIILQWMLAFVKPVVTINENYKESIPWNRPSVIRLVPGRYHVKVHFDWIFSQGNPGSLMVDVHEGHATELSYHTKFFIFMAGDLKQLRFRPWGS